MKIDTISKTNAPINSLSPKGCTWKAKFSNNVEVQFWTPLNLSRAKAKIRLLDIANYGRKYPVYFKEDIIQVWKTKE